MTTNNWVTFRKKACPPPTRRLPLGIPTKITIIHLSSLPRTPKQRELKQRRRRRQRERQKTNRLILAKQQLCTCITHFCTFLSRRCTITTWKCVISRFVEDGNTRQQPSFFFLELWYSLLEFNSRKICQHLTNSTSWNMRDKVWGSTNSLFKWRFRSRRRRRRCCLNSLKRPLWGNEGPSWAAKQHISLPVLIHYGHNNKWSVKSNKIQYNLFTLFFRQDLWEGRGKNYFLYFQRISTELTITGPKQFNKRLPASPCRTPRTTFPNQPAREETTF